MRLLDYFASLSTPTLLLLLLVALADGGAQAAEPRTRRDIAVEGDADDVAACRAQDFGGDTTACAGVTRSLLQNVMKRSAQFDAGATGGGEGLQAPKETVSLEEEVVENAPLTHEEGVAKLRLEDKAKNGQPVVDYPGPQQSKPDGAPTSEQAWSLGVRLTTGAGVQLANMLAWVRPHWHRVSGGAGMIQNRAAEILPVPLNVCPLFLYIVIFFALCLAIVRRSRQQKMVNSTDKTRPIELTPSVSKLAESRSHCQNLPNAAMYQTCGSAIIPRAHPFNNMMLPPQPQVPYSSRLHEHLCPGLVVPHGHECLLAIRLVRSQTTEMVRTHEHVAFDIVDMQGRPVLKADIAPAAWSPLSGDEPRPPPLTLRTPSAAVSGSGSPGSVLSVCQMASPADLHHHHEVCRLMDHDNIKHIQQGGESTLSGGSELGTVIYNVAGEVFGVLTMDPTHPRYVLVGRGVLRSSMRLFFGRSFGDFSTVVTNEHGETLADTEPTTMPFDADGKFYRVKVNPATDVGLVLSGLIAIDAMEAHLAR